MRQWSAGDCVASKWGISRQAQDELALQSHQRAAAAIKAGYFKEQILPIESKVKGQIVVFDTDEHVKADTTLEKLAKLRPAFKGDGSVTAGNASGINDAAAAVVLMEGSLAQQRGLHPDGEGALRTAPRRRQVCAGHDVHRWRSGHRCYLRSHVSTNSLFL